jgi:sortase A
MRLAKFLGAVGRTCITAGVLILLFVAYQLWGTGIRTAQAQNRLEEDFQEQLDDASTTTTSTTETTVTTTPGGPVTT